MAGKTICVDFDGVLAHYDGWKGATVLGKPVDGAKEFVDTLIAQGYSVAVHSTRSASPAGKAAMERWLSHHGFPKSVRVFAGAGKPGAIAYVDDRAVRFRGDFAEVLSGIEEPPWWRKGQ